MHEQACVRWSDMIGVMAAMMQTCVRSPSAAHTDKTAQVYMDMLHAM